MYPLRRAGRALSALSLVVTIAFGLATAVPEADGCRAGGCSDLGSMLFIECCDHGSFGALERGESQGQQPGSSTRCAGPSCLCHQHLRPLAPLALPVRARGWLAAPLRAAPVDLGVVQELLHVPRARA